MIPMPASLLAFGMPAAPEWIFLAILALVLFGPKKLPELARGIGKALGELQKAKEDFRREITGVPPLPRIESPSGQVRSGGTDPVTLNPAAPSPAGVAPEQATPENPQSSGNSDAPVSGHPR